MKTIITFWKLAALCSLAVAAIIWAASRMEAKSENEQKQIRPQVRETADDVGIAVQGGVTHGQTIRFNMLHSVDPSCREESQMTLTIFDSHGATLVQQDIPLGPNQDIPVDSSRLAQFFFDLNADQLPQQIFDEFGRAELTGLVSHGGINHGGIPGGGCVVAAEVFDNLTGRTLIQITAMPLPRCTQRSR
jgi:hypothetical protein